MDSNTGTTAQLSAARPTIPSRLLDLSASQGATLAISSRNQKESRLLALPSEILNKILKEVVADQTVHVLPEGSRKYKTRICADPEDCPTKESPRIHLAPEDNTVSDGMDDDSCYTLRHKECEHSATTKSGLNLDVLLVCRQIYREASLLPFQENTFVFGLHAPIKGPRPNMAVFVNRLKHEQREAIRHVTIVSGNDLQVGKAKGQLGQLRGLQSLHVLIHSGSFVTNVHFMIFECLGFASMYRTGWLPLKTFRISMEAYLDKRGLDALSVQTSELDRLVRGIEAKFLRLNSKPADAKTALPSNEDVGFKDHYDAVSARLMQLSLDVDETLGQ